MSSSVVRGSHHCAQCVVPENIHTHPMDGSWKFSGGGVGGLKHHNFVKERMLLNWKFQRGEGVQMKKNGHFPEQHNAHLESLNV